MGTSEKHPMKIMKQSQPIARRVGSNGVSSTIGGRWSLDKRIIKIKITAQKNHPNQPYGKLIPTSGNNPESPSNTKITRDTCAMM